jgi:hypothetical protein
LFEVTCPAGRLVYRAPSQLLRIENGRPAEPMEVSAALPLTIALEHFMHAARQPPDEAPLDLAVATVRVLSQGQRSLAP